MKECKTLSKFLGLFAEKARSEIRELVQPDDAGLVCFEGEKCGTGDRTAMIVGPTRTYKTIEFCRGRWLKDLPSDRQHAAYYWRQHEAPDIGAQTHESTDGGDN